MRKGAFRAQFRSLKLAEDGPFFAGMFEVDAKVFGKKRRRRDGIIVAEQNEFTTGRFDSGAAGSARTAISLTDKLQNIGKLERETKGFGAVGRPVVDHNHFPQRFGEGLEGQSGEADVKNFFAIEGWQHDGYFWRGVC